GPSAASIPLCCRHLDGAFAPPSGMDFAPWGGSADFPRRYHSVFSGQSCLQGKRGRWMAYKFFDTLLDSGSKGARRTKRKLTLPVSIAIHVVVLAAVFVVPLLSFNDLPEPVMSNAIRAFLVEAAPAPPPPPPPPPAASAPRPMTQPKVVQPKPVVEQPKFTAPIETPKELPKPEPDTGRG